VTADGYTSNPPSGGGEGGGPVAISDVTGLTAALAGKASTVHTHVAADVTDSTSVGRSVLTAVNAAAARTAIGAEPSGAALAAVAGHVEAADPHTQYALETDLTTALALKAPLASPALTGNPTAPTQTAGNNSTRLATTAYVETAVAAGGGGGGSTLVVRRGSITSGNLTLASSGAWAAVSGGPSFVLPAAVGDYVEFSLVSALFNLNVNFLELAVSSGGSLVRYLGTGGATPATEGAPPFYGDQSFERAGPVFEFVVEAGDLSGGNVTVVFATQGSGGGTIYASTDYPLKWRAMNHGSVS
jgi:hypothetical protein